MHTRTLPREAIGLTVTLVSLLSALAAAQVRAAAPVPAAADAGTVTGELSVGSRVAPFQFVYVTAVDDVEGRRLRNRVKTGKEGENTV